MEICFYLFGFGSIWLNSSRYISTSLQSFIQQNTEHQSQIAIIQYSNMYSIYIIHLLFYIYSLQSFFQSLDAIGKSKKEAPATGRFGSLRAGRFQVDLEPAKPPVVQETSVFATKSTKSLRTLSVPWVMPGRGERPRNMGHGYVYIIYIIKYVYIV